ncbi:MAG: type II toxin-antitoxin system PemK/MazF family toxin [Clostridiales bacterium]|nr:type II toxin-antitoxin system PemK/MazF family toxin [Clostridiales bacterium]
MKEKGKENNFIMQAKKTGRIKDGKYAFIEYLAKDEWHKGKIENVLCKKKVQYYYNIGDIVFVKDYEYLDGSVGTKHLFVIIDKKFTAVPIEYWCMIISSNLNKLKYSQNILLQKDNINGLNKDSVIKTDVIYNFLKEQILFKVGEVDLDTINTYKEMFLNN